MRTAPWRQHLRAWRIQGNARVDVEVDDSYFGAWESDYLDPGQEQAAKMSLGRVSAGEHTALVYVNPGSGSQDHDDATFIVESGDAVRRRKRLLNHRFRRHHVASCPRR
jgi:hypothetical protein